MELKGYKSVIFFGLVLGVALANLFGFGDFQMSADQTKLFEVIVPVVGLVLRYFTDSAIFKK
jgi:hypothetical protein